MILMISQSWGLWMYRMKDESFSMQSPSETYLLHSVASIKLCNIKYSVTLPFQPWGYHHHFHAWCACLFSLHYHTSPFSYRKPIFKFQARFPVLHLLQCLLRHCSAKKTWVFLLVHFQNTLGLPELMTLVMMHFHCLFPYVASHYILSYLAWAVITNTIDWELHKDTFLTFMKAGESKIKGANRFSVYWCPASWLAYGHFLIVSSCFPYACFHKTLIPFMRAQSSWPAFFPQAPYLNAITLGIRASTYEWGHKHSVFNAFSAWQVSSHYLMKMLIWI